MNMEANNNKSFIDYSTEIACQFLQTAVTIDDNLLLSQRSNDVPDVIIDPENTDLGIADLNEDHTTTPNNALDYQTLSVEFAKKGIVCCGLTPKISDSKEEKVRYITNVMKNADLAIIDWEINDKGELAREVIAEIAHHDFSSEGQLRLICIFTGSTEEDIPEKVASKIRERNLSTTVTNAHIDVTKGQEKSFWRVVVIPKKTTADKIAEEDLPNTLIAEFSELTAGLLSNAMLSAIGEIRNSTHRLLARFNSGLDSAYISHLIGLISLDKAREQAHQNAFDYAAELIAEQLKSEIQVSKQLKKALSKDVMGSWPEWRYRSEPTAKFEIKISNSNTKSIDMSATRRMLTFSTNEEALQVLNKDLSLASINKLKEFEKISVEFKCVGDTNDIYVEFSALEVCRRDMYPGSNPDDFIPVLKQGTILRDVNCGKFYVCLQPLCDSVRLTEKTFFLFVEVLENEKFTHALRTFDGYVKLKIDPKTCHVRSFSFRPCQNSRVVLGGKFNSRFFFTASHNNMNFNIQLEWIGELKNSIAQSLATTLTGNLGRIGLDTFEWLRLNK